MRTVRELLVDAVRRAPDGIALLAPGQPGLRYAELLRRVDALGATMIAAGAGRGTRIGVDLPNGMALAIGMLAACCYGAAVPFNPHSPPAEIDASIDSLGIGFVLTGPDSAANRVAAERGVPALATTPEAIVAGDLPGDPAVTVGGAGTLADDVVLVLRTSGTTGAAKVVPLQNAMMCAAVQVVRDTLRLRPDDRCLNVMPLVHVHGFVAGLLAPLASGGSVVCAPGMDGRQFGGWLVDTAATWYTAVPTMHQTVAALLGTEPSLATRSRLRFIRSASAPLAPSIAATLEAAFKVPVLEAYGMTEAAHQIASNPLPPAARKPGSVGTPTGSRVSIMDASGRHLDPGQVGEVAVGGPRLFAGYERAAGLDRSAFVDGWFQTGDQGYLDDEGYLFLTGRSKEMINRGGETIAPRVVDEVLLEHPGVAQAVAFGLPDARLGEIVAAAVVAVAGTQVSPQELRRFAATRLAAAAVPEQIFLVANIPVGPTGKMQRVRLAGLLAPLLPPSSPDSPLRREPTTASECLVAGIWMELLNLPEIGLDDRFTDLGGDSALAMRVLARLKNLLGFRVSDSLVLTAPTVAELAAAVAPLVADGAGRGPDVTRSTT